MGSSSNTSSPTSACDMAFRMAGQGWVTVSLRRSIVFIFCLYCSGFSGAYGTRNNYSCQGEFASLSLSL